MTIHLTATEITRKGIRRYCGYRLANKPISKADGDQLLQEVRWEKEIRTFGGFEGNTQVAFVQLAGRQPSITRLST